MRSPAGGAEPLPYAPSRTHCTGRTGSSAPTTLFVGADAYIGPNQVFPHPRQGTRALPYKMCGCRAGPMCPAATGASASPEPQGPYGGQWGAMKKYAIRARKLLTNGREHGIIIFVLARLAQLVEHMLDVHGVTGSSPVPRTIVKSPGISWVPGLFVILPKCASLGFGQMPLKAAKTAFSRPRQKQHGCITPYTLYILMAFGGKRWVGGVKIFGHTIDLCKNSV